jgi:hypothetical protein
VVVMAFAIKVNGRAHERKAEQDIAIVEATLR